MAKREKKEKINILARTSSAVGRIKEKISSIIEKYKKKQTSFERERESSITEDYKSEQTSFERSFIMDYKTKKGKFSDLRIEYLRDYEEGINKYIENKNHTQAFMISRRVSSRFIEPSLETIRLNKEYAELVDEGLIQSIFSTKTYKEYELAKEMLSNGVNAASQKRYVLAVRNLMQLQILPEEIKNIVDFQMSNKRFIDELYYRSNMNSKISKDDFRENAWAALRSAISNSKDSYSSDTLYTALMESDLRESNGDIGSIEKEIIKKATEINDLVIKFDKENENKISGNEFRIRRRKTRFDIKKREYSSKSDRVLDLMLLAHPELNEEYEKYMEDEGGFI